jgi:hypothetical protein
MMKSLKRRRSTRSGSVLLGAVAVAVGLVHGCRAPQEPEFPVAPVCAEQARMQGSFVELARQSLLVYGRIDPLLFQIDANGKVVVDPDAKERAESSREGFEKALSEVQADPAGSRAFQANLERALKLCSGGGCEPTGYPIDVKRVESKYPDIYGYTWEFQTNAPPSETQLKAFELLYTYLAKGGETCAGPDPINVQDPTHGVLLYAAVLRCYGEDDFPRPPVGGRCKPPRGAHWIELTFGGVIILCCL